MNQHVQRPKFGEQKFFPRKIHWTLRNIFLLIRTDQAWRGLCWPVMSVFAHAWRTRKNILSLSMEWRYRPYTLYVYAYFLMLVNYIQTAIWTITLPVVTRNVNTGTTEYKHWIRGRALEVQYYIISFKVWIMECTPNSTTYTFHTICASVIRNTGSFRGIASCTIDITSSRSQSYPMSPCREI